jgi:hypothetical protein
VCDQAGRSQFGREAELGQDVFPRRNETAVSIGLLNDTSSKNLRDVNAAYFLRLTIRHLLDECLQRWRSGTAGRFDQRMSVPGGNKAYRESCYVNKKYDRSNVFVRQVMNPGHPIGLLVTASNEFQQSGRLHQKRSRPVALPHQVALERMYCA